MRIAAMATMVVFAGMLAHARKPVQPEKLRLSVCTEVVADFRFAAQSQGIASKMFAALGVRINWRQGLGGCPPQGILITLSDRTPPGLLPGALAYAMPYQGAHIRLFYDRIAQSGPALLPHLLAHVLAHEIAHILQGIVQHSDQGVMKAHWTQDEYNGMLRKPLDFTGEDIDMIYRGLAARAARSTVVTVAARQKRY
jgi:hypothetical protein